MFNSFFVRCQVAHSSIYLINVGLFLEILNSGKWQTANQIGTLAMRNKFATTGAAAAFHALVTEKVAVSGGTT
jgi:hypothetical protein